MLKVLVIVAVLLFGALVWPTPYRYDRVNYGYNSSTVVRINRFTGVAEYLTPSGWSQKITFR